MRALLLAWITTGILCACGCGQAPPAAETAKRPLPSARKEVEAALARALEQAHEEKGEYEKRLEGALKDLEGEWKSLNERGPHVLKESRAAAERQLDELSANLLRVAGHGSSRERIEAILAEMRGQAEQIEREGLELLADAERKLQVARQEFAGVRDAPSEQWRDARQRMDEAYARLRTAMEAARSRFPPAP